MIPVCHVHGVPMKPSQKGNGFFCSQKMPDGSYCKMKAQGPATPQAAAPAVVAGKSFSHWDSIPNIGGGDAVKAAALRFAGELCHGAGPEMSEEAIAIAIKAVAAMKAV